MITIPLLSRQSQRLMRMMTLLIVDIIRLYWLLLIIYSVIIIKCLPPYSALPSYQRNRCLLPPKSADSPPYTLVYFFIGYNE